MVFEALKSPSLLFGEFVELAKLLGSSSKSVRWHLIWFSASTLLGMPLFYQHILLGRLEHPVGLADVDAPESALVHEGLPVCESGTLGVGRLCGRLSVFASLAHFFSHCVVLKRDRQHSLVHPLLQL